MKKLVLNRISRWGWLWISILWSCAVIFYTEFFGLLTALGLGTFITLILLGMLLIGYIQLGSKTQFPWKEYVIWIIVFSIIRYAYVYFFLSRHLPEHTIFHYVDRVIPTIIFGSASLLFIGYSYAIYEWGMAARTQYATTINTDTTHFKQPLTLRCGGKTIFLLPQDIIFINANGEYVDYNTASKKYTCFKRLKEVESEMVTYGFKRSHRGFIVNLKYVASIGTSEIVLKNKNSIPLSKTYKNNFKIY